MLVVKNVMYMVLYHLNKINEIQFTHEEADIYGQSGWRSQCRYAWEKNM